MRATDQPAAICNRSTTGAHVSDEASFESRPRQGTIYDTDDDHLGVELDRFTAHLRMAMCNVFDTIKSKSVHRSARSKVSKANDEDMLRLAFCSIPDQVPNCVLCLYCLMACVVISCCESISCITGLHPSLGTTSNNSL